MPVDPAVVADGQLLRIDRIVARSQGESRAVVDQQESVQQGLPRQLQKVSVGDGAGEVAYHLPQHQAPVLILETLEARQMVERQDGVAAGRQRVGPEIGSDFQTEIIDEAKNFHDFGRLLRWLAL